MPIMDGIEATEVLKTMMENNEISNIPIIGLTAGNEDKERNRA